jgi:hypothetical protein
MSKVMKQERTYKIIRFFSGVRPASTKYFTPKYANSKVLRSGLTLEQAAAHCRDPETSWLTCKGKEGLAQTEACGGAWNDQAEEEYPTPGRGLPEIDDRLGKWGNE